MLTSSIGGNHSKKSLRLSDPDLPILATDAAIELDRLLQGQETLTPSVEKLAAKIKESLTFNLEESTHHSLDPTTITILGDAINEIREQNVSDVRELIKEAVNIAVVLEDKSDLEKARNFCIAFSRLVSAYLRSTHEFRPYYPYTRLT